jgi:hypothetical protein
MRFKHNPNEFKELRENLGLSQAALAHLMGVSSGTVCRWEQPPPMGRAAPESAYILIEFLGLEGKLPKDKRALWSYMVRRNAPSEEASP